MFIIESIRVRNFRAIEEARLEPLADGITGIFGPNGAGKTTFLTALLFAMYGVRPDGVNTAALRRDGADPNSECSVSVVCRHMNQTVEILREISNKGTSSVFIYVDGIEQGHTSTLAPQAWIRNRFGIDAEGFMTAFVVRQKELDLLVSSKPAPRKALIEKLAGIDTINVAVKEARAEENDSKKILDKLPGSAEEFMDASEEYEEAKETLQNIQAKVDKSQTALEKAERNYDRVNSGYMSAKDKLSYVDSLVTRHKNKLVEVSSLEERLIIANSRHSGMTVEKLADKEQMLKEADKVLEAKREEYMSTRSAATVAAQNVIRLENDLKKLELVEKPTHVDSSVEEVEEKIRLVEDERNSIMEALSTHKSELKNIQESINVLHDKECPVCHREWDNHEEELAKKESTQSSLEKAIAEEQVTVERLRSEIQNLTSQRKAAERYAVEKSAYEKVLVNIKQVKKDLAADKKKVVSEDVLETIKKEGVALLAVRDNKHTEFTEAKTALQFASDVVKLSGEIKALKIEVPRLEETIASEQRTLPDIKEIELELREARLSLDESRSQVTSDNKQLNDFNSQFYLKKNRFERAQDEWTKKSTAYKRHQRLVAVTDLLDGFRKHAIGRLAPELSDYATSLISEMTSGAFTEIILNDEFTPSVVDAKGVTRPAASLSGGEVSAVALALRISIAFLITNENPELLWLDEVLTAQDTDRRSSMLSTIRRLPISQIVMINHTQEASDVVDKIVTLSPADSKTGKGSFIESSE
jgi:exonuclease SbcC